MTPPASGRPLRFFFLLMAGWIAIRIASQPGLPTKAPVRLATATTVQPSRSQPERLFPTAALPRHLAMLTRPGPPQRPERRNLASAALNDQAMVDLLKFITFSVAFANRHHGGNSGVGDSDMDGGRGVSPLAAPLSMSLSPNAPADRWHGSAWALWRGAGASGRDIASVGRLGGSHAGIRVDYDFTPNAASRTIGYARATSALASPAAPEAAIGIAFQPLRTVPVSVAAERRIALGTGGRNANAVMVVGGFGPDPVGDSPLLAEAYAQAGMVGFNRRDAFIDGKLSLLLPIARSPIRVGSAISGGAQPEVERIDIGPEIQFRLPLPQIATRISIEWRERIAGRAAPASGLAVTLAADF